MSITTTGTKLKRRRASKRFHSETTLDSSVYCKTCRMVGRVDDPLGWAGHHASLRGHTVVAIYSARFSPTKKGRANGSAMNRMEKRS